LQTRSSAARSRSCADGWRPSAQRKWFAELVAVAQSLVILGSGVPQTDTFSDGVPALSVRTMTGM